MGACGWVWEHANTYISVHTFARVCTCVQLCAHVCTYVRTYVHVCTRAVLGFSVDVRGWVDGWLRVAVGGCEWVRMCGWVDGGGCGWLWVGVGVRGDI